MSDITLKMIPVGEYEYVDADFSAADTDVTIPYKKLHVDDVNDVRWIDISPNRNASVYRGANATFGPGYVKLRSSIANYSTRLLLFTERNQSNE